MVEEIVKEKKKYYKKWWFWTILLLVIITLLFVFRNDVEAKYKGIDVKYLDDPLYCEQNSDCTSTLACEPVNIHNHNNKSGICEKVRTNKAIYHICYPENGCMIENGGGIGNN